MKQYNWEVPQRQPLAGLAVVFVNTLWEVLKKMWPFLLLPLLRSNPDKPSRFEIIALVILGLTVIIGIFRFWFFKFYIEGDKLIIKKGWIKKETKIIPLEKIQTVNIEQSPVHQFLNIVKVSIDTAGSQETEGVIDALKKPMAEALQEILLQGKKEEGAIEEPVVKDLLIQLNDKDLLKLSISSNHIETLFIILLFVLSIYQNISDIDEETFIGFGSLLSISSSFGLLFLSIAVLMITILVSTARIFFTFYNFRIYKTPGGFQTITGLTHIKERSISFSKIQFLSIKANWIRKLMHLWMLEYYIVGGITVQKNSRVKIPITRKQLIPELKKFYHIPDDKTSDPIKIHISYVWRKIILSGLLPAAVLTSGGWFIWGSDAFYFLLIPFYVSVTSFLKWKKFKLFALEDVAYIKTGVFGEEEILFKWYKLQSVAISQSIFQRSKGLATLTFHTAGGKVQVPFIPYSTATLLLDYALVKSEFSNDKWM